MPRCARIDGRGSSREYQSVRRLLAFQEMLYLTDLPGVSGPPAKPLVLNKRGTGFGYAASFHTIERLDVLVRTVAAKMSVPPRRLPAIVPPALPPRAGSAVDVISLTDENASG